MKTKLLLIASLISAGLIFMSFQTLNELTAVSSLEQAGVTNNYSEMAKNWPSSAIVSANIQVKNYPDPFYDATSIEYKLPKNSYVRLYIHDLQTGKPILLYDGVQSKGTHVMKFDAKGLPPGEYIAELITHYFTAKTIMHKLDRSDISVLKQ